MKLSLFVVALTLGVSSVALAQSTPSPANMGIMKNITPNPLQVLDSTNHWVTIGTADPSTHVFTGTGPLSGSITVGSPVANGNDGQLLYMNGPLLGAINSSTVNATQGSIGMAPGTQDNSPFVSTLMNTISPPSNGGMHVTFPATPGQTLTTYHFSKPLQISRAGTWDCGGYSPLSQTGGTALVFDAGITGVRLEDVNTSPDGGNSQNATFENCYVRSLGYGTLPSGFTAGNNQLVTSMPAFGSLTASSWNVNDSFVIWGGANTGNIAYFSKVDNAFTGTGEVTNGIFKIDHISTGTFALGAAILTSGGGSLQSNVGIIYATALLSGSLGADGSTYSINQPGIPNKAANTSINGNYSTMTVPPTIPTAATSSFTLNATSIPITSGTCSVNTPAGEDLFDITSNKRLGTVQYCVPDNGSGHDTVYITSPGAAAASTGSTDNLKFWSVTSVPIGNSALWWSVSPISRIASSTGDTHAFQISTSELDGITMGGGGTYILSFSQPYVISNSSQFSNYETGPASPPGSYIDAVSGSPGAQTLTVHTGFEPILTSTNTSSKIYQLPATQAYMITTNSPSSTQFTVTAGPSADPTRKLWPGDFIVSETYPYGCVVDQVSGNAGAQVVKLQSAAGINISSPLMTPCSTTTGGSHRLWVMPSGIRMSAQGQLNNNFTYGWPVGINFYSTGKSIPAGNGTGSTFKNNSMFYGLIGFLEGGGNTAGSVYLRNEGAHNSYVDFAFLGSLGNPHHGDNANSSEEDGYLALAFICSSSNLSAVDGSYLGFSFYQPVCIPSTGMVFQPTHIDNGFTGPWVWNPYSSYPQTIGSLSRNGVAGTQFQFAPDAGSPGIYFDSRALNPLTNIFQMYFTTHTRQSVGSALSMFYNPLYDNWEMAEGGNATLATASDVWGAGDGWMPAGGYGGGQGLSGQGRFHGFPNGFTIGGAAQAAPGAERLVDASVSTFTNPATTLTAAQPFIIGSNIIAVSAVTGVSAGRTATDTTVGASSFIGSIVSSNTTQNWLTLTLASTHNSSGKTNVLLFNGGNPIAASDQYGTTMTMIPVANCTGVVAAQTVTDLTDSGAAVGTVSACGTGQATMVITNTAGSPFNSSGATDTIVTAPRRQGDLRINLAPIPGGSEFWTITDNVGSIMPSGIVALESTGRVWKRASINSTIGVNLPTCATALVGGTAIVTNGLASPAYWDVVGSTGSTTRPVFCSGDLNWHYD